MNITSRIIHKKSYVDLTFRTCIVVQNIKVSLSLSYVMKGIVWI